MLGYGFYTLLWETFFLFVVLYIQTQSLTFCVLFKAQQRKHLNYYYLAMLLHS